MRFVRYNGGAGPAWGVQTDEKIHVLGDLPSGEPSYQDLADEGYLEWLSDHVENGTLSTVDPDAVSLLAPVPRPGKIVCAGLNYRDHAEEQDEEIPDVPLLFSKAPTTVTNPNSPIVHPGGEEQVDYEVELAVVIGRTGKGVTEAEAQKYVAGYTALNDVSGRDAQFSDGQFFRGKSYDTFSPMGPSLAVGPEVDPHSVDVETRVDGEVRQSSNTEQFIFDVDELIAYISEGMTLRPGDVISTGTPGGVGIFSDPPTLLEPGMTCEVEIEGIGTIANPVVES
jgi:2-keto-4-pentenoate hydratase/2-oxohepta-3-ene-1,7-dioic acid hydratase in catechol pathway